MSTFYPENDYRSYLAHHGVKGMKWGVRKAQEKKNRKMRKHGITSEEYDRIKEDNKKTMKPVRKIMTGMGALSGLGAAQAARRQVALREGMRAFKQSALTEMARRSNRGVTLETISNVANGRPSPGQVYLSTGITGTANEAAKAAIARSLNNPISIATLPIGAAAGAAAGAIGGKILEEILADNEMRTAGLRRDRRYN